MEKVTKGFEKMKLRNEIMKEGEEEQRVKMMSIEELGKEAVELKEKILKYSYESN